MYMEFSYSLLQLFFQFTTNIYTTYSAEAIYMLKCQRVMLYAMLTENVLTCQLLWIANFKKDATLSSLKYTSASNQSRHLNDCKACTIDSHGYSTSDWDN